MTKLIQPPAGLSDAEESEWWYANRQVISQEIEQGFKEGRMRQFNPVPPSRRGDVVLLDPEDASKARIIAEKRGVDYETFVKNLIHQELEKADAA